jgi:hypothetical protein
MLLTEHHAKKAYLGVGAWPQTLLASALNGAEWSASRSGRFIPRERALDAHWIGGWVSSRAGLDAVMRRNGGNFCGYAPPLMNVPD